MIDKLLQLYTTSMAFDVRSPTAHVVGPPGTGKSSMMQQLADLLGVHLHIINVARLSPLEVEGVQMPQGSGEEMILRMLPARYWTRLQEGDIVFFDEFLRGYPEVYNSLLDIFTSRRVGGFHLPKVFIIAASNSVVTYDPALEDRLLHIPVPDMRRSKTEQQRVAELFVNETGLMPEMAKSMEVSDLFADQVFPSYDLLDAFKKQGTKVVADKPFTSVRKLIGQVKMRYIQTPGLMDVLNINNNMAMREAKPQYVVLVDGKHAPSGYEARARKLDGNPKLTEIQQLNIEINLQLLELERAKEVDDA